MMKLTKKITLLGMGMMMACLLNAQNFMEPIEGFSTKQISYVTMADGTEVEGQFKQGQVALNGGYKWIYFKPTGGKKKKIKAAEISSMLLPQSKLSKISEATSMLSDATKWDEDVEINKAAVKEGYAYFETITIAKKKKDITAIRQILNPGYAAKIKVLDNRTGMNGPSASIGGMKVAGGKSRSYYIKVGDAKAIKVSVKKYAELFETLYGSCPAFIEKNGQDPKFSDIEAHVFEFSQMCKD